MKNKRYAGMVMGLLMAAVMVSLCIMCKNSNAQAAEDNVSCSSLCAGALKVTGNTDKIKFKSEAALDFGALSSSDRKRVSSIFYVCDKKEVYSIAVIGTGSTKDARALYKSLKAYKKSNSTSDYLSDYTRSEQKVFKNAVIGKKGSYVWYIAMSGKKSNNTKGSKAIRKSI